MKTLPNTDVMATILAIPPHVLAPEESADQEDSQHPVPVNKLQPTTASPSIPKIIVPSTEGFASALDLAEAIEKSLNGPKMKMKILETGHVLITPPDQDIFNHIMSLNQKLATSKADLSPAELASEARASVRSAPTHAADIFFTDGSVDTTIATAAAAVHHDEFAALYRLPDNSSTLQTELLAILRALQLAVPRDINVTIHTDSLGAIQALQTVSPKDNVNLITSVLATTKNIHGNGRYVHLNWVPSHTGIPGNEAADLAAKEALSLPQVTAPIPPSISQIKASVRRVSHEQAVTCLRPWITNPTSSAHWYNTTRTNTTPFTRNIGRKTRNALHRVRIGYKCLAEIKGTLPLACCHCDAETVSPLKHYVMDCPATSDMLARGHAAAKDVIANTSHDALARLVTHHPPPR
ncbi:Gag-Pol polyprotein [Chionoecetes opilio]|uniref:ribonuclease H n=1 Tax=Chionoecetes opilio TaxID=41210 RepID=A0A8J4XWG1_CHIOP|nr:Gag-Pol polyprotein [Chionoecetes opilio]